MSKQIKHFSKEITVEEIKYKITMDVFEKGKSQIDNKKVVSSVIYSWPALPLNLNLNLNESFLHFHNECCNIFKEYNNVNNGSVMIYLTNNSYEDNLLMAYSIFFKLTTLLDYFFIETYEVL